MMMTGDGSEQIRDLDLNDVKRMMVPERYWIASVAEITGRARVVGPGAMGSPVPLRDVILKYIKKSREMVQKGTGLMLYGNNGRGKTCALVSLGMQLRRRGFSVLYVEVAKLKDWKINRVPFQAHMTMWERIMSVDVLIFDDLGKGVVDSKGFTQELVDEIVRTRGSHLRTTLVSTNIEPSSMVANNVMKKSTLAMLTETVIFFSVEGDDNRRAKAKSLAQEFMGGDL